MSRIMGDALVGGPEATNSPEMVTVRLTRGQAEACAALAEQVRDTLDGDGYVEESWFMFNMLTSIRAQIGGSR